jgi:hypothetical protein
MSGSFRITVHRPWRLAWSASLALHAMVMLGGIAAWMAMPLSPEKEVAAPLEVAGRWSSREMEQAILDAPSRLADHDQEARVLPDPEDSRWGGVMEGGPESSFVREQIRDSIRRGQQRSGEDNLQKLSQLSRKLQETSSPQGVDEIAGFLSGLVGSRATEPTSGQDDKEFDVATAQIHRVRKESDEAGLVRYIATLIDRNGAAREIELDPKNGEQLYKTMQLIQSNPLLERVYRTVVMGILDQVLSAPAPLRQEPMDGLLSPTPTATNETP